MMYFRFGHVAEIQVSMRSYTVSRIKYRFYTSCNAQVSQHSLGRCRKRSVNSRAHVLIIQQALSVLDVLPARWGHGFP